MGGKMKIVCECGNELEFVIDDVYITDREGSICVQKEGDIRIVTEYDKVWITCNKCGKAIHFYT